MLCGTVYGFPSYSGCCSRALVHWGGSTFLLPVFFFFGVFEFLVARWCRRLFYFFISALFSWNFSFFAVFWFIFFYLQPSVPCFRGTKPYLLTSLFRLRTTFFFFFFASPILCFGGSSVFRAGQMKWEESTYIYVYLYRKTLKNNIEIENVKWTDLYKCFILRLAVAVCHVRLCAEWRTFSRSLAHALSLMLVHYACVTHQITVVHYYIIIFCFFFLFSKRRLYVIRIYYELYFRFGRIFRWGGLVDER